MSQEIFVFKSNGIYLGFIKNDFIFSRDGAYLGWLEGQYAWDNLGRFRGVMMPQNGHNYILFNQFSMPPVPKTPKPAPAAQVIPAPQQNIQPITLPVGFIDGF